MRAVEPSCLRGVLSVSLGPSATWEKRLEARRSSPAFLSTDLGDEDVGMGPPASPGAALQGPQGSGVIRGGEGAPLPGTARMHVCVHVCVCVGGRDSRDQGLLFLQTWPGCPGGILGFRTEAVELPVGSETKGTPAAVLAEGGGRGCCPGHHSTDILRGCRPWGGLDRSTRARFVA